MSLALNLIGMAADFSEAGSAKVGTQQPDVSGNPSALKLVLLPMAADLQELLKKTKEWSIVGMDLVSEVTCQQPYEWKDPTGEDWEYRLAMSDGTGSVSHEPLHVSVAVGTFSVSPSLSTSQELVA